MATITAAVTVARLVHSHPKTILSSSFAPSSLTTLLLTLTTTARPLRRLTTCAAQKPYIHTNIIGHVGHGKTTVNAALSMALEAFVESNKGANKPHNVLVDYPMLSDYAKNMISGVVDMAGAILVVCGVEGPTRVTEEHIRLAKLGGVPKMVVFLNKQDLLVDGGDDRLLALELEVRELLSSYEFPGDDIPIVAGSALLALEALKKEEAKIKRGENEWVDKICKLMDEMVNYIPIPYCPDLERKTRNFPFWMSIADAYSVTGGRGGATVKAIGTIERGEITLDDIVDLVGLSDTRRDIVVTGMNNEFGFPMHAEYAGQNVDLLLSGVQKNDIHWGMVLAKPGAITFQRMFTAMVYMLRPEEGGITPSSYILFEDKKLLLYMATSEVNIEYEDPEIRTNMEIINSARQMVRPGVAAKVNSIMNYCATKYPSVEPGQHAKIELELITPIACFQGMRFDIQDRRLKDVGVGLILDFIE